jgi:hypothetical protein
MIVYFNLAPNYNFKVDVKNTRLRNNQKDYNKCLLQINAQGNNRVVQYINSNTDQIIRGDIPTISEYMNNILGNVAIQFDANNLLVKDESSNLSKFAIPDNDLAKQKQIKEMRNTAKQQRGGFTKEDVAKKIWQYKYLPPGPRTNFFERNAQETTKFREIQPVPEFTRKTYLDPSVDLRKK